MLLKKRFSQKNLLWEVSTLLMEISEKKNESWIIKIHGKFFVPQWGDLLIHWPSGEEGEDLIVQYCKGVESVNFLLPPLSIKVTATPRFLGDSELLKEFEKLQSRLRAAQSAKTEM